MARKGRVDRGLVLKRNTAGEKVWYVRLYHNGQDRRFGGFTTKTKAREFYENAKRDQADNKFFPERYQHGGYVLIQELLDRHLAHTTVKNRFAEANYARWWGSRLRGQRINAVTPSCLDEAKRELFDQGLAAQTVLHYLKFLRHVLNLAVRDEHLDRNPFAKVDLPTVVATKTRCLTTEEETKVLTALGPIYGPWARLALLTGLRKTEQLTLRWADVNLDRGLLTLPTTKAGGVQYVHLNAEAKAILRTFESWQSSVWVFPSENPARPLDGRNLYARIWMPAVRQAGIDPATWHDLRHTFASRLAMNGATEGTVAALLRHSTTALVKRYAHLSPSHLQAAVEGLSRVPTGPETGTSRRAEAGIPAEAIEKFGAGDGI